MSTFSCDVLTGLLASIYICFALGELELLTELFERVGRCIDRENAPLSSLRQLGMVVLWKKMAVVSVRSGLDLMLDADGCLAISPSISTCPLSSRSRQHVCVTVAGAQMGQVSDKVNINADLSSCPAPVQLTRC